MSSNIITEPTIISVLYIYLKYKIILQQSVKLTDLILLLQLVISSPLIHALGDLGQP